MIKKEANENVYDLMKKLRLAALDQTFEFGCDQWKNSSDSHNSIGSYIRPAITNYDHCRSINISEKK